ncbi:MAG: substrate-binding domain-containing protein [Schumannella sp.]
MPIKPRTWWTAIVASGAVLALAACAGSTGGDGDDPVGDGDRPAYSIGWLGGLESDPYFITMMCGALDQAESLNATVEWKGVNAFNNIDQINQNVDALLLGQPNGFVFTATGQNDNYNVLKVNKAGIPLVVAQNIPGLGEYYQAFPSSYPQDKVEEMAQMMVESSGGEGTVAVFVGAPGPTYEPRWLPMVNVLSEQAPGLNVLEPQYTQFDTNATSKAVAAAIVANPDLKIVYTTSGGEAAGAISAIKTAGKTGEIQVYTFNATPTVVAAMRAGEVQAILTTNPDKVGRDAITSIVEHLDRVAAGEEIGIQGDPHVVPSDVGLLTPENLDDPEMAKYLFKENCD